MRVANGALACGSRGAWVEARSFEGAQGVWSERRLANQEVHLGA